jgi:asparagine synthase (glutamine-hydrolysing)
VAGVRHDDRPISEAKLEIGRVRTPPLLESRVGEVRVLAQRVGVVLEAEVRKRSHRLEPGGEPRQRLGRIRERVPVVVAESMAPRRTVSRDADDVEARATQSNELVPQVLLRIVRGDERQGHEIVVKADLVLECLELEEPLEQVRPVVVLRRVKHEVGRPQPANVLPPRELERALEARVDVVAEGKVAAAARELPQRHDLPSTEPVEEAFVLGVCEPALSERKEEATVEQFLHALHDGCMCGICGIARFGAPPETATVEAMAAELDHRGPDAAGSFSGDGVALAARRLAIVDLSEAGAQPFASEDGSLQLVHNGEVYNYRELRRELEAAGHRFRSQTDTEVLLASYVEWGDSCVERFNGMWAFALWDGPRRRLFCSRDRFGVKPFYYRHDEGRFVFASEPRAFRADPQTRLEADRRAVHDYLDQAYLDHTGGTFFAGIERLPPAHSLILDEGGLHLRRYWQLELCDPPPGDAADALRELVLDSIRLRLRSDVPIGTALSGGLDSSTIAVAVDRLLRTEAESAAAAGPEQRTFTAYFEARGFDERPYARAVVERTRARPAWTTFGDRELAADLPAIVEAQGEPFGSTSICAGWYVMREAKRSGVKVMLDGQGGDEVLAGYRAHLGFFLADLLAGRQLGTLRTELAGFRDLHRPAALATAVARPFAPDSLTRFVRARARGASELVHADLRDASRPEPADGSVFPDRLRRFQEVLLTRRGLPELLRYEDRNSMAHSLEARVPFLDYRVVELCFALPADELIRAGETKSVLRRAFGDLLPSEVRARRDKVGFVTPEGDWMRGALGELTADVFASHSFRERGFVDASAARRRLERHRRGEHRAGMELWRALNLELWAREFLDA